MTYFVGDLFHSARAGKDPLLFDPKTVAQWNKPPVFIDDGDPIAGVHPAARSALLSLVLDRRYEPPPILRHRTRCVVPLQTTIVMMGAELNADIDAQIESEIANDCWPHYKSDMCMMMAIREGMEVRTLKSDRHFADLEGLPRV